MTKLHYIRAFALGLALCSLSLAGCKEEEAGMSDALMVTESSVTVPAAENDRIVTIYADKSWVADVSEDWLSLDPSSGEGTVDVTVHFDYNSSIEPRTAHLYVQGSSHVAMIDVEITQKGDRYKDAAEYSVGELAVLEAGTLVKVKECQVAGFTKSGFVAVDGESAIYVSGSSSSLETGDKITMTGEIVSLNGIAALQLEDPTVTGSGDLVVPEAQDLTEGLSEFVASLPTSPKHVSFHGSYSGSSFSIGDDEMGKAVDPLDALLLSNLALRYVDVEAWYIGQSDGKLALLVLSAEDEGSVGTIYLGFEIETSAFASANKSTFPTTYQFAANTGTGYIQYVPYDLASTNGNSKFAMDISGNDPRCTGPWPEDYWLFYGDSPIKSGSKVEIKFGCRTSATGHKYWILEYLDGKTWKTAGTPLVSEDIPESAGGNVTYTHAMNSDGATNVIVDETVVFERNVEHGQFRFRCVANWQASGKGALTARNGGSARLAVSSAKAVASQPTIVILEEGDGSAADPVEANISVSVDHLAFDGIPADGKTFTVSSDYAYTLTSGASWLHLDVESGAAGQEQTVTVTCDTTTLSSIRETTITILSNETVKTIPVVQGAAGQDLEPFVSIVGSNKVEISADADEYKVGIQANVEWTASSDVEWITIMQTKSVVSVSELAYSVDANADTENSRIGHITVVSPSGLESVLTVVQLPKSTLMYTAWQFSAADMPSYQDYFGGTSGVVDFEAGNGGKYVPANLKGSGKIEYWQVDKTAYKTDDAKNPMRIVGSTGHPYVTGAWPGDYWLFSASDGKEYPSETKLHISFLTRVSATGHKYWLLEYFDGSDWKPASDTKTAEVSGSSVTYTHTLGTSNINVDVTCTLAAACTTMQFRFVCAANCTTKNAILDAPNGGTMRIAGAADGTSPVFEVVE